MSEEKTVDLGKVSGESAYEAAKNGGYTGTQAEFNALLAGLQGALDSKAPGGYGLGVYSPEVIKDDFNSYVRNGWYSCSASLSGIAHSPPAGAYGGMQVTHVGNIVIQDVYAPDWGGTARKFMNYRRVNNISGQADAWGDWFLRGDVFTVPQINVTVEAADLADYVEALPRLVMNDLWIIVSAGTCLKKVTLNGFYGPGRIWIKTDGGVVSCLSGIIATQCRCNLALDGLTISGGPTYDGSSLAAYASSHVELQNCVIDGTNRDNGCGVMVTNESSMSLLGCTIKNTVRCAVEVCLSSICSVVDSIGSGNSYGAYVWRGGIVLMCGTTPTTLGGTTNRKSGGLIAATDGTLL